MQIIEAQSIIADVAKKKKSKASKQPVTGAAPLANNPFASLSSMRESLPVAEHQAAPAAEVVADDSTPAPRRAVVRYERKGRGGKEVTAVEKLELSRADLDTWCRDLKRSLGCGGSVEGDNIVLSGDQRARLPPLLEARGVGRISVG